MGAVRSMTGYGRGEARAGRVGVTVEVKTVNHRFLDLSIKLPRESASLEALVQRQVRDAVTRGRVELTVRREVDGGGSEVIADPALFQSILAAVEGLLAPHSPDSRALALTHALSQPGVLSVRTADVGPADDEQALVGALSQALRALTGMREAEGRALLQDLHANLDAIERHVGAVREVVGDLRERAMRRIADRVRALVGDAVDPARIAQEAALLAEKADVAEELTRLASHTAQLRDMLGQGEAVGRRVEFLLQEMGREANTIGSKTVDAAVARDVVEIKALLERLREQAANVE
jgi:uncharacterized protein (TIGR00255 family)